jgi:homocitrate synthase NifV
LNPLQTCDLIGALRAAVPDLSLEFHGHNDLGMATANTIAALASGADAASVTVNGLGERAGNAPLDEVVMAARLTLKQDCGVDTRQLSALSDWWRAPPAGRSRRKSRSPGGGVPARIGHSLRRAAGRPRDLRAVCRRGSRPRATEMVVGRHSGTRLLRHKLEEMKLDFPPELLLPLCWRKSDAFSAVSRKRNVTDAELQNLADQLKKNHGLPDL